MELVKYLLQQLLEIKHVHYGVLVQSVDLVVVTVFPLALPNLQHFKFNLQHGEHRQCSLWAYKVLKFSKMMKVKEEKGGLRIFLSKIMAQEKSGKLGETGVWIYS